MCVCAVSKWLGDVMADSHFFELASITRDPYAWKSGVLNTWTSIMAGTGQDHPFDGIFDSYFADEFRIFCGTGRYADWRYWPKMGAPDVAQRGYPRDTSACLEGVAVLSCPTNAYGITGLPSGSYVASPACPTAEAAAATGDRFDRADREIYAFSSVDECRAAVAIESSVPYPTAMTSAQDMFGAHARVGGDVAKVVTKNDKGHDLHMVRVLSPPRLLPPLHPCVTYVVPRLRV